MHLCLECRGLRVCLKNYELELKEIFLIHLTHMAPNNSPKLGHFISQNI